MSFPSHDRYEKNKERQDSITPIVKALDSPRITLIKKTTNHPVHIRDYNINFAVYSRFDKHDQKLHRYGKEWINIALYHGPLNNSLTDGGFALKDKKYVTREFFDGYDFVFLGDIHRSNQSMDKEGRVRYPGSTVQQNFGEKNDKGCLIWEITDADNFKVKHIKVSNPNPFYTVDLTKSKNWKVPANARLKLIGPGS